MENLSQILKKLLEKDKILKKITNELDVNIELNETDKFTSLVKIIIGQQLSNLAAKSINNKLEKFLKKETFIPIEIIKIPDNIFYDLGVSKAKTSYIKGLAKKIIDHPNFFDEIEKYSSEKIIKSLIEIKGVGIWTASIFVMNSLKRLDVFPYGDTTIEKSIKHLYPNYEINDVIQLWSPFQSIACKIIWKWYDNTKKSVTDAK